MFGCALVGAHFARKTKRGTKRQRDGDAAEGEEAEGDEAACPPPRRFTLGHYRDSMYFGVNAQNRSGADALACETPYGQRSLDAREYARIWRSGAAHAAVSLADEHGGWESAKKSKRAAIRTRAWLDACAKEAKALGLPLFGALTGGEHAEVREECSRRVAERDDDVVGYALSGFFAGEDVEYARSVHRGVVEAHPERETALFVGDDDGGRHRGQHRPRRRRVRRELGERNCATRARVLFPSR